MKTFLFDYMDGDERYQLDIKADTKEEACRRLRAIQHHAVYKGELQASIPLGPGWFWKLFFR